MELVLQVRDKEFNSSWGPNTPYKALTNLEVEENKNILEMSKKKEREPTLTKPAPLPLIAPMAIMTM